MLAAGDISKCGSKENGEATANLLLSEIEAARKAGVKVHVLALGDLAYDNGRAEEFACVGKI